MQNRNYFHHFIDEEDSESVTALPITTKLTPFMDSSCIFSWQKKKGFSCSSCCLGRMKAMICGDHDNWDVDSFVTVSWSLLNTFSHGLQMTLWRPEIVTYIKTTIHFGVQSFFQFWNSILLWGCSATSSSYKENKWDLKTSGKLSWPFCIWNLPLQWSKKKLWNS